jgi:1-acyl-sn-glycerol-3-phosphate acyltransferase
VDQVRLSPRIARQHAVQRLLVSLIAPLWIPLAVIYMRHGRGYRIRDLARVRSEFDAARRGGGGPLLLCANHLTLVDSFLILWALQSPWKLIVDRDSFAWNTPERTNFAASPLHTVLTYLAKCIPITRGGQREAAGSVLNRVVYLLRRGELALIFPEGGRSRTGRVDPESGVWGVGRIIGAVPSCRVLCLYLRGDAQETWGSAPARGDTMSIEMVCIEPKSDLRGARRSRDLALQVTAQLALMEAEYFDGRQ